MEIPFSSYSKVPQVNGLKLPKPETSIMLAVIVQIVKWSVYGIIF